MKLSLCICDDEVLVRKSLFSLFSKDYLVFEAKDPVEALEIIKKRSVDILLLDIQMKTKNDGLEMLPTFKQESPDTSIIMISGLSDFRIISEAMKKGARDYWVKGAAEPEELVHVVKRTAECILLERFQKNQSSLQKRVAAKHEWIGKSEQIVALRRTVEKVKNSKASVLITGETGTGKEVVARSLRNTDSKGSLEPFIAVDSATIQSSTAESQLFGYEKGAFTGADKAQKGLFEEADGGILYFDELANMPLDIQNKLLRAIQEKEVCRMGSARPITLDFRVVSATNQNLQLLVQQGKFKEDLLQRLEVIPIDLPPLRDRTEDIPLLVEHFGKIEAHAKGPLILSEDVTALLANYSWPGNIRELRNLISYLCLMSESNEISIADLPPKYRNRTLATAPKMIDPTKKSFYAAVEEFESQLLKIAYTKSAANISKMALELEMDRSHLYAKLKQYQIHSAKKS